MGHFGERGWLAIDPKRLRGERGIDYDSILCNPDHETAIAPGRLARQVEAVAEAAVLERKRRRDSSKMARVPRRSLKWRVWLPQSWIDRVSF